MPPDTTAIDAHHWEPQPLGAALIHDLVEDFLARSPESAELAARMRSETGTRFKDWIDFIEAPDTPGLRGRLNTAGFTSRPLPGARAAFVHEGAIFPTIILNKGRTTRVGLKVESAADFATANRIPSSHGIEGSPMSPLRRVLAYRGDEAELWAVERHGGRGFAIAAPDAARSLCAIMHLEAFRRRERDYDDEREGIAHAHVLADAAVRDLGVDATCDLFFIAEREYWQSRNRAGQFQKARQDRLGLGWANHDHHTYRSSRHCYGDLIHLLESMGFRCRERFYAGNEAGWGAQVLEQHGTGITIFADVDMSPEELMGDFAHQGLPARHDLGTIGLWCALHGEAVLQAGMHHLEAQFDWYALRDQLEAGARVRTMDPFTTFPYLRQAFTEGERWPVPEKRLQRLVAAGQVSPRDAEEFRLEGALGSHLENLERNDGFKGFNQEGVSQIISATDPRKQAGKPHLIRA